MGKGFDVQINGVKARLARAQKDGAATFKPFFVRQSSATQELGAGALKSNSSRRPMRQTGWQGGSTWWQPLMRQAGEESSYFTSRGLNAYEKPGFIFPIPNFTQTQVSMLPAKGSHVIPIGDVLYFMTDEQQGGGDTNVKLGKLEDFTFTAITGATAGTGTVIFGMVHDSADSYFYVLATNFISRVKADGTEDDDWIASGGLPASLALTAYGEIWYYNGNQIRAINKAGASLTSITNDGLGQDFLSGVSGTSMAEPANPILYRNQIDLMISTAEGVYYVKNVQAGNIVQPWVFRVEKNEAGDINSVPIANLPPGTVALSIASFLDSILITYSADIARVFKNDQADPYITGLYHISGGNKGMVGIFIGEDPDESPSQFLGSDEKFLYIGGHKRIWVYDGVRGGLHPILETPTIFDGSWRFMATNTVDSGGKAVRLFFGTDQYLLQDIDLDTDEVTNFGDDLVTHRLQSNPFDFDHPFELKTLSRVHVNSELLAATQRYLIRVRADGGSWQTVAAHTNEDVSTYNVVSSNISGYVFEYEIIWEAKSGGQTYPSPALRDLMFEANIGSHLQGFELVLDGTEMVNVENQVVRVDQFFDNMMTLGATETPITFIHYLSGKLEQEEANTFTVYVQELSIQKGGANEAQIALTLVVA